MAWEGGRKGGGELCLHLRQAGKESSSVVQDRGAGRKDRPSPPRPQTRPGCTLNPQSPYQIFAAGRIINPPGLYELGVPGRLRLSRATLHVLWRQAGARLALGGVGVAAKVRSKLSFPVSPFPLAPSLLPAGVWVSCPAVGRPRRSGGESCFQGGGQSCGARGCCPF